MTNYSELVKAMQSLKPWQFLAMWAWLMTRSLAPWGVVTVLALRYGPIPH